MCAQMLKLILAHLTVLFYYWSRGSGSTVASLYLAISRTCRCSSALNRKKSDPVISPSSMFHSSSRASEVSEFIVEWIAVPMVTHLCEQTFKLFKAGKVSEVLSVWSSCDPSLVDISYDHKKFVLSYLIEVVL